MRVSQVKYGRRVRRKAGIRKRLRGTAERPRLAVYRSSKHIYAQIIDDERGKTLCEASTRGKENRGDVSYGGNVAAAKVVGELLAKRAMDQDITTVCFDRGGFRFHGRVKMLAEAAREAGLKF